MLVDMDSEARHLKMRFAVSLGMFQLISPFEAWVRKRRLISMAAAAAATLICGPSAG